MLVGDGGGGGEGGGCYVEVRPGRPVVTSRVIGSFGI